MIKNLILISIYILCVSLGNILIKIGMSHLVNKEVNFSFIFHAFTSIKVIIGLMLFVVSIVMWLIILSRMELTFAHPLLSISVVVIAVISWTFFNETFNFNRVFGIALTILGSWFVIKS